MQQCLMYFTQDSSFIQICIYFVLIWKGINIYLTQVFKALKGKNFDYNKVNLIKRYVYGKYAGIKSIFRSLVII